MEKILEMLKGNELTVKEIAHDLNLRENYVNVYITRLKRRRLIEKIGKKNRYYIYTAIQQDYDKENNDLIDKLVLLMIKAEINSEKYGININEIEIEPSIKRLTKGGLIG